MTYDIYYRKAGGSPVMVARDRSLGFVADLTNDIISDGGTARAVEDNGVLKLGDEEWLVWPSDPSGMLALWEYSEAA